MMKYKTELHCHSRDGSGCSSESAEGIVKKYLEYGYSSILLTNHFVSSQSTYTPDEWKNKIASKYSAYDKLVSAADGKLNILIENGKIAQEYVLPPNGKHDEIQNGR